MLIIRAQKQIPTMRTRILRRRAVVWTTPIRSAEAVMLAVIGTLPLALEGVACLMEALLATIAACCPAERFNLDRATMRMTPLVYSG